MPPPDPGKISWLDLTIPDADPIRDFYAAICGWTPEDLSMGDYADYVMKSDDGEAVAGICHTRGVNASLPPVWLPYISVPDLQSVLDTVVEKGGEIIEHRPLNHCGGLAVIKDPAGAYFAFWQQPLIPDE